MIDAREESTVFGTHQTSPWLRRGFSIQNACAWFQGGGIVRAKIRTYSPCFQRRKSKTI